MGVTAGDTRRSTMGNKVGNKVWTVDQAGDWWETTGREVGDNGETTGRQSGDKVPGTLRPHGQGRRNRDTSRVSRD